jgi:hypothetical protein
MAVIFVPIASNPITLSGIVGPTNARYPQNKVSMQTRIIAGNNIVGSKMFKDIYRTSCDLRKSLWRGVLEGNSWKIFNA